jgi:hypothetical protein
MEDPEEEEKCRKAMAKQEEDQVENKMINTGIFI